MATSINGRELTISGKPGTPGTNEREPASFLLACCARSREGRRKGKGGERWREERKSHRQITWVSIQIYKNKFWPESEGGNNRRLKLPHHVGKVTAESPIESVSGSTSWERNCGASIYIYFLTISFQLHQQLQRTRSSIAESAREGNTDSSWRRCTRSASGQVVFMFAKICFHKKVFCKDRVHKNGCRTSK